MSTLLQTVLQTVSRYGMLCQGDSVLCCVSGGADSAAMLHLLAEVQDQLGISVNAIHVNHGLRGEESDRDEAAVRKLCEELGVALEVSYLQLSHKRSIEETARELRYQAFFEAAVKFSCNRIATAHTENDNAETVLLHLTRGSGLHGLTGIPAVRGNIIRPLLGASREAVLQYLFENGISYCEDSSNACVEFSRNRIRHRVVSELSEINPAAVKAIANTASLLSQDEDFIRNEVARSLSFASENDCAWRYPCERLTKLHPAISSRVMLELSRNAVGDGAFCLESARIADITALLHSRSPSAEVHLSNGLVVRRVYDELEFTKRFEVQTEEFQLHEGERCRIGRFVVHWMSENDSKVHKNFMLYELDSAIIADCITVRSRKTGDRIKRIGRPCKTLKRLMIDEKIGKHLREELPVLVSGENLILVHGVGIDERFVSKSNQDKIKIEIGLCCDETERSTDQ